MTNSKTFYEVRDSIANGTYRKASRRTLRRYRKELNIVLPWEGDPLCDGATTKKREWLVAVNEEIEKRKAHNLDCIQATAKGILKYFVAPLTVLLLGFFLLRPWQQTNQATPEPMKKTPQMQSEHKTIATTQADKTPQPLQSKK